MCLGNKERAFMESHISQVFFISNLQPHGVKRQHLYVQSIGNLLSLMMIVRHIFIKFLIGFAFKLTQTKNNLMIICAYKNTLKICLLT